MGWDSYWGYYKPAKPKEVREGIKTKSKRGAIGETWWSKPYSVEIQLNAILKRLGAAPFAIGKTNLASLLAKAYEVASSAALQKAAGESEEDAETKNATK